MKEVTYIDPVSAAKITALLGILWAVLGWLFSGIVITLLVQGAGAFPDVPPAFSLGGLLSGVIGGFIGGGLSGYLGSLVYNVLARKFGGIILELQDQQSP